MIPKQEHDIVQHPPQQEGQELKRGLKSRHLTMISIGGAIGTGLFLSSGAAIHTAGAGMAHYLHMP